MALLNLSAAAKLAGVTRVTLRKHIQQGYPVSTPNGREYNRLSTVTVSNGNIQIDSAEIIRVYGETGYNPSKTLSSVSNQYPVYPDTLNAENIALRAELRAAHQLLAERGELVQALKDKVRLLEHKPATYQPPAETEPHTETIAELVTQAETETMLQPERPEQSLHTEPPPLPVPEPQPVKRSWLGGIFKKLQGAP